MPDNQKNPNVWKGMLVGLIAGLAASWTMNRFQDVWIALSPPSNSTKEENSSEDGRDSQRDESADDATAKAASAVSEGLFEHELTPAEKRIAGAAVHYAVGGASGIVYGVAAEFLPEVTSGLGFPYGTAFWLVVDEGAVPLLGLSKPPADYPLSTHIYALASHLIFGATAEGVRRLLRS
jgi:putative membrane protein